MLDAFRTGDFMGWVYELYFHHRDASAIYVPFDPPYEKFNGEISLFDRDNDELDSKLKPYDKTMIVNGLANHFVSSAVPEIWDNLSVPFTDMGIWQALLLHEAFTFMPKGWHGNYSNHWYVFSQDDMQQIIDDKKSRYDYTDEEIERLNAYWRFLDKTPHFDQYKKSNYDKLVSYLECEDILPSVKISGDEAVVSYCYWNEWSGFCRATVPVERCGQSVTIGEHAHEVLVAYDCGILY